MNQIDYSQIPSPVSEDTTVWEPPGRVFFGKRNENGKRELEPESNKGTGSRVLFPSIMYGMVEGKITARVVNSEAQRNALGKDWKDTPAVFGYVGAPDFEASLKIK